ncbi:MAG TPA: GMP synthase [Hypericibacter adhaerens]|jgi:GMP synthase (glutamine-hydrolysing)|uniref:glutamine amidotransferase-related protein n=1 Tax=Hypericibacter adhaerens TaxID=2602016 RepID=UPI002B9B1AF1|nr:GMP synthase [Hypericibacter adhaerens]HWA43280.1 GMP synthase [Hypericibacter adhaerens]
MSNRIVMVVHSEWRERRITPHLASHGYQVECRCPAQGEPLPDNLDDYAGAIVLGGVQSANDADSVDYMRQELDWIRRWVEGGRRYLGICLGGQLLARALGATVKPHPEGLHEIGYWPIEPTHEAGDLFSGLSHVYHWHKEGFDLPRGAELLARGSRFPHQAFRWGAAYGLQFHPEVTGADVHGWLGETSDYESRLGAPPRDVHLAGIQEHDPTLDRWTRRFIDRWIGKARATAEPASVSIATASRAAHG